MGAALVVLAATAAVVLDCCPFAEGASSKSRNAVSKVRAEKGGDVGSEAISSWHWERSLVRQTDRCLSRLFVARQHSLDIM